MTTTQTERLMALADRYAFHIPGSQHSDEARAVLLAALQEQAREGHIEALKRARDTAMDQSAKSHIPECGHFAVIAQDLDWAIGNVDSINTSKERVENDRANVQVQAREGESVKFLANGKRFKLSSAGGPVAVFLGFPPELAGRWVALVAAEDDCHLKLAAPQPAQPEQRTAGCTLCGHCAATGEKIQSAQPVAQPLPLTDGELDTCRQWFDCVQDTNAEYLEPSDYLLAEKLYKQLNMRVPHSISEITAHGIGGAL